MTPSAGVTLTTHGLETRNICATITLPFHRWLISPPLPSPAERKDGEERRHGRKMVSGNLVMLEARVYKRDPWIKVGVPSLVLRLWPANKRLFTRAKRREEEKLGGI